MKARDLFPYWPDARDLLVQAVERLDDDQLDWHPVGAARSIREMLQHIVAYEHQWLDLMTESDDEDVEELPGHQLLEADLPLPRILSHLEAACSRLEPLLDREIEELRSMRIRVGSEAEFNYHWVICRVYDHEAHHRGQIFLLMRMQGLEPPET